VTSRRLLKDLIGLKFQAAVARGVADRPSETEQIGQSGYRFPEALRQPQKEVVMLHPLQPVSCGCALMDTMGGERLAHPVWWHSKPCHPNLKLLNRITRVHVAELIIVIRSLGIGTHSGRRGNDGFLSMEGIGDPLGVHNLATINFHINILHPHRICAAVWVRDLHKQAAGMLGVCLEKTCLLSWTF
jgi:hypothetical protein